MAFTDALFEGVSTLDRLLAKRLSEISHLSFMLRCHRAIPVAAYDIEAVRLELNLDVIVDARMRKRHTPENQRGLARLCIGLGPNFVAGQNADVAIETSWGERLGAVVEEGPTESLGGEPQELSGHRRERFAYSPVGGEFRSELAIGANVERGQRVGKVGENVIQAPLAGTIRGLTHDGATVDVGTKILEIDANANGAVWHGLGLRPRRIADGVLTAISNSLNS
jgi:xanthine dehydrogenase accessory factor